MRADADLCWSTLQHFLLIWAPLTFRRTLEGLLGAPLHEPPMLDAWAQANVDLFQRGCIAMGVPVPGESREHFEFVIRNRSVSL